MAKGGTFENEIAKLYSLWWSEGKRDDIFYRTGGSGSRFTARGKLGKSTENAAGDLGYVDPIGKPFIDFALHEFKTGYTSLSPILKKDIDVLSNCHTPKSLDTAVRKIFSSKKHSNTIDLLDIIDSSAKIPLILEWIQKAEKERKEAGRRTIMIVFRRFMKSPVILMPDYILSGLEFYNGPWQESLISIKTSERGYYVMSFARFLEWVDGESFRHYLETFITK